MGAIFRRNGDQLAIKPSANIAAGDVVKVAASIIGVATSPITANTIGFINTRGEYDVDVTAGTAYGVGDMVPSAAIELDGDATTVVFGPAVAAATKTDSVVRCRLIGDRTPVADSTGGTAGTELVAPASTAYTADELTANFATLAKALNL